MALNFPDSPTVNQIYTDSTSGFSYQWDGTVWKSYSAASTNTIRTLDDISGSFDDVTTIFALTANGDAISPANAQQLLISVGGVMQSPNTDYSVSGSNIIFTTAPQSGLTFFGTLIGTAVPVGITTVGDVYRQQSYAVTGVQTSFSFPAGYTVGFLEVYRNGVRLISGDDFTATDGSSFDLTTPAQNGDDVEAVGYITASIAITNGYLTDLLVVNNAKVLGITTLGTNVGVGQTALFVEGNARISGILTVGSSSVTIDGVNDEVRIGNSLTINSTGITGSASSVTSASVAYGLEGSPNLNVGIITTGTLNVTGQSTLSEIKETTYELGTSGSIALDPANGSIQSSVLAGNPTFTDSLEAGQTVVLMLEGGATYSVTWPTITWVTSAGNAAPTLTAKDTLVLWKVSTTLYGAYVGSYV